MKNRLAPFCRTGCLALALFSASLSVLAEDVSPQKIVAGSKLDRLTIGTITYHNVLVRSISARSAMITHDGGMKSILLRDLTPELQQRFNYNAEADRAQEAVANAGQAAAEKQQRTRIEAARKYQAAHNSLGQTDQLLRSFGQKPELSEEVDLRPRFNELGLWAKDQGHRPSCAVFAMVSALEFQSAEISGQAERYSEEYLYWATCKNLNYQPPTAIGGASDSVEDQTDSGFTLEEVATALRTYGIPLREKMPNRLRGKTTAAPTSDIVDEARRANRTYIYTIPGHDGSALVANIVQALNLGIPVPVGLRWPDTRVWRVQFLEDQKTEKGYGHAVTIVGYRCKTGNIEDAVFIFKNSWGPHWGQAGYGTAAYRYLAKNLESAVVLEVQSPKK